MSLALKNVALHVDGKTHIHDTSVQLHSDGFNVLLGTTLAGKTTLMQLMAGLLKPSSGEVWFNDVNVTGVPVQKRRVAMVYQQFINYPNMTVFDNIASPLRVARMRKADILDRVGPVAQLLRLNEFLDRKPAELSGGQQQRCAMARALVKDADLVLLDEPLANLDYKLREELRDELPRLFADRNCTVVYATTEPSEALLLGGHTAAMREGRITQFGAAGDVYRKPVDLDTAQVYSEPPMNTMPVRKRGEHIVFGDGRQFPISGAVRAITDGDYELGIRAHYVVPQRAGSEAPAISGNVQITEISGSESTIHFELDGRSWVSQAHGIHAFDVGESARFELDLTHAMIFSVDGHLVHA